MILVSACLAGIPCKYNGKANTVPAIAKLVKEGKAIPVCPEQLGGLPTPRVPAEIQDGKVINQEGIDVTKEYLLGATKACAIAKEHGCINAIVKSLSPSCGCNGVYDGTFTHTKIEGKGIFAQMCEEEGILCEDEQAWKENIK